MKNLEWLPIEPVKSVQMPAPRRQAQNALHWMARMANSYVEPQAEERHIELLWNSETSSIRSKQFLSNISIELRLDTLELQFCENGSLVPHTFSFQQRTPAHVEAWILVELLHRDVKRDQFSKVLPYTEKDLMMGDSEEHEVEEYINELSFLNGWLRNAAAICTAVGHEIKRNDDGMISSTDMPVICWPQSFHLGIELDLRPGFSAPPSIRSGLSAGDALRSDPFFFTATAKEAEVGDFNASNILSVQRITSDKMNADDVISFMCEGIHNCRKRLAN